jgi:hypothetical protein
MQGKSMDDTGEFILRIARFAKFHSHYIHGRKGSDQYDLECESFINVVFSYIVHYRKMDLMSIARKKHGKASERRFT